MQIYVNNTITTKQKKAQRKEIYWNKWQSLADFVMDDVLTSGSQKLSVMSICYHRALEKFETRQLFNEGRTSPPLACWAQILMTLKNHQWNRIVRWICEHLEEGSSPTSQPQDIESSTQRSGRTFSYHCVHFIISSVIRQTSAALSTFPGSIVIK